MNEKNIELVKKIMMEMKQIENPNTILFDTSFTQIAKTNLLLLKGFLDMEDKKGYFVVLDRPHQYMAYLLHMHDISQENIWYIDTVTHMSGGRKVDNENVDFIEGAFHIEQLFEKFEKNRSDDHQFASPNDVDFILIDNISSMLNYNSMEKVEEFVESFRSLVKNYENLTGCLVIDSDSHPELDKVIQKHVNPVIDVKKFKEEL